MVGRVMFDLIGDIHGHADELVQLLNVLGYQQVHGIYRHPERKVIFLGDLIDRGRQIREVLEIARGMVEGHAALAILGNHEWNAMAFHTIDPEHPGEFLRRHTTHNRHQISKTLEQLSEGDLRSYLDWFHTLPIWLDLEGLRVVHACWDASSIELLDQAIQAAGGITTRFLQSACRRKSELFSAVESVLKGKEAPLPEGVVFHDKDGSERNRVRTRWYLSPNGHTYQSYAFETAGIDCPHPLHPPVISDAIPYPETAKPVFIGHYWQGDQHPSILADNVACLDFSVAKGGFLCAYRWNGEQKLCNSHFVTAKNNR